MGTLYEHLFTFMKLSLSFLLRVSLRQKIYRKSKTHILFLTTVVPKWGLLRFNIEKCGRARHAADNNITRCMRFACWITEATDTHSDHVYLSLLHDKNSHGKAPQCHAICVWPVWL